MKFKKGCKPKNTILNEDIDILGDIMEYLNLTPEDIRKRVTNCANEIATESGKQQEYAADVIEKILDEHYAYAKRYLHNVSRSEPIKSEPPSNVLFEGPGGCGKTTAVAEWLEQHPEIKVLEVDTSTLDRLDVDGVRAVIPKKVKDDPFAELENSSVIKVTSKDDAIIAKMASDHKKELKAALDAGADPEYIEALQRRFEEDTSELVNFGSVIFNGLDLTDYDKSKGIKYTVLVCDELNRGNAAVLSAMLNIIGNRSVKDPKAPKEHREMKHMLFTIAMQNPPGYAGVKGVLDKALVNRFNVVRIKSDPAAVKKYLDKLCDKVIQQSEKGLEIYGNADNIDMNDKEVIDDYNYLAENYYIHSLMKSLGGYILSRNEFAFDDDKKNIDQQQNDNRREPTENFLSARSFMRALVASKGMPYKLLQVWNGYCGTESATTIKQIIDDYVSNNKQRELNLKNYGITTDSAGEKHFLNAVNKNQDPSDPDLNPNRPGGGDPTVEDERY